MNGIKKTREEIEIGIQKYSVEQIKIRWLQSSQRPRAYNIPIQLLLKSFGRSGRVTCDVVMGICKELLIFAQEKWNSAGDVTKNEETLAECRKYMKYEYPGYSKAGEIAEMQFYTTQYFHLQLLKKEETEETRTWHSRLLMLHEINWRCQTEKGYSQV